MTCSGDLQAGYSVSILNKLSSVYSLSQCDLLATFAAVPPNIPRPLIIKASLFPPCPNLFRQQTLVSSISPLRQLICRRDFPAAHKLVPIQVL